jgi:hypothetical protein
MRIIHVISGHGQPGNKMTLIACGGEGRHSFAKNTSGFFFFFLNTRIRYRCTLVV